MLTKAYIDGLTKKVIGAAIEVHKELGPGLLEKVYQICMEQELTLRGIKFQSQQIVPIIYKGIQVNEELRYDLLVEDCLIVELKALLSIPPIYEAQTMTYMKLLKKPKGILINFNVKNIFYEGQKTFVNEFYRSLPIE
jgi:GxxExxY protein